jgi:hypothetical protein
MPVMDPTETKPAPRADFVREHFGVLIVFSAFCLLLAVYIMELHWSGNDAVTLWLQNKMSDLLSALLMGLTAAGGKVAFDKLTGGGK